MIRNTKPAERSGETQVQRVPERGSEVSGGVAASLLADPSEVIMAQVKAAVKSALAELASPWLTVEEAAARLKVGRKVISALCKAGVLRGRVMQQYICKQLRFHRDDVDRVFIEGRRITR